MGVWGTILAGAATVGGVAIGQPWIGPVVGAVIAGKEQSDAAKKAGQQQIAAGNQAMDIGSQMYNSQTALLSPWRTGGQSALNAELGFLGLPSTGAPMAAPAGSTLGTAGAPTNASTGSAAPPGMQEGAISDPSANGGYAGVSPGTATLGSVSSYTAPGSYGPKSNPRPSFKVKNAAGDTKTVSAELVADAQKDGWSVVGAA